MKLVHLVVDHVWSLRAHVGEHRQQINQSVFFGRAQTRVDQNVGSSAPYSSTFKI
jgi:hypothetical protein